VRIGLLALAGESRFLVASLLGMTKWGDGMTKRGWDGGSGGGAGDGCAADWVVARNGFLALAGESRFLVASLLGMTKWGDGMTK
jgi:hypothetical protein